MALFRGEGASGSGASDDGGGDGGVDRPASSASATTRGESDSPASLSFSPPSASIDDDARGRADEAIRARASSGLSRLKKQRSIRKRGGAKPGSTRPSSDLYDPTKAAQAAVGTSKYCLAEKSPRRLAKRYRLPTRFNYAHTNPTIWMFPNLMQRGSAASSLPRHPTHCAPSFLVLSGILRHGEQHCRSLGDGGGGVGG